MLLSYILLLCWRLQTAILCTTPLTDACQVTWQLVADLLYVHMAWNAGVKVPNAIQMLGRNCGLYTEDDLLLSPEGDGGVVVGDSSCPAPSGSRKPASRASSLQPSVSRYLVFAKSGYRQIKTPCADTPF